MTEPNDQSPDAGPTRSRTEVPDVGNPDDAATTPTRRPKPRRKSAVESDLHRGVAVIQAQVRTLHNAPGVYRMLDSNGDVLYVGKARGLKKRVTSYTQIARLPYRLQRMVSETVTMEVVSTHTEAEALLLESNFIKRYMPRFNVLLRDDKSFPYILLTGDHAFPQVVKHRGARNRDGDYFGPFASAGAVNRTITALQRAFLLRNCSDSIFAARTRPCLQYQIKRCAAPCVGYVDEEHYRTLVAEARAFLTGQCQDIQSDLAERMQEAAARLDFETAARYRDRIRALTFVQGHQDVSLEGLGDADVIGLHQEGGQTCIEVFFFRGGQNFGNRAYFPSHDSNLASVEILASFVAQFYDDKPVPPTVLLSEEVEEMALIAEALGLRSGAKVTVFCPRRGNKRKLVSHAVNNARDALARRLAESASQRSLLRKVGEAFALSDEPQRIEVYDNSHNHGSNAYGAMIVAGPEGFMKSAYRKFSIRGDTKGAGKSRDAATTSPGMAEEQAPYNAGDDFSMMREVLTRRFGRALREDPERSSDTWPDLVVLDGGVGQLHVAESVMRELGLEDIHLVAMAKGPDRDAGRERFFLPDGTVHSFENRDPVLYFLQRLRDEAHRFAIGAHRTGRAKQIAKSALDDIPGIGANRKKALLHHFGSARAVSRAGLSDLEKVSGISKTVARRIYDHFHEGT